MFVQVQGISKTYSGKCVLGPIDVMFPHGKTSILLGQSGCGKSTLMRLILGLISPDQGTITIDGAALSSSNARQLRRKIGFVTQDGGLFPHLSALDNIMLAARYFKEEAIAERRLRKLLEMSKLDPSLLDRYPAEISGGQRQRVSLIRALILEPELILLDEPMAALDPMIRAELQSDLKNIFSELKKTVIMVTHDVAEAAFLGDAIILMHDGLIVQQGSFSSLVHEPRIPFVSTFLAAQRPIIWPSTPPLHEDKA